MVERQSIDYYKREVGDVATTKEAIVNKYNAKEKIMAKVKQKEQDALRGIEKDENEKNDKLYIPKKGEVERLVIDKKEGEQEIE